MIKSNEYEDIINCARPISQNHPQMSRLNRAAQFAPFAALVGYEDSIDEAKRIVDKKILLTNEEKENINKILNYLKDHLKENIEITIVYFIKDNIKNGVIYNTKISVIKKIDEYKKEIHLIDKTIIKFVDIKEIIIN